MNGGAADAVCCGAYVAQWQILLQKSVEDEYPLLGCRVRSVIGRRSRFRRAHVHFYFFRRGAFPIRCSRCSKSPYLSALIPKQVFRNAKRSLGRIFSASACFAHACCLSCSALRFSAASRNSGATLLGSTNLCACTLVMRKREIKNCTDNHDENAPTGHEVFARILAGPLASGSVDRRAV